MSVHPEVSEFLGLMALRLGQGKHQLRQPDPKPFDEIEIHWAAADRVYVMLRKDKVTKASLFVATKIIDRDFHDLMDDPEAEGGRDGGTRED